MGGERGDYWRRRIGADRASAPSADERLRCNALSACERLRDFLNSKMLPIIVSSCVRGFL